MRKTVNKEQWLQKEAEAVDLSDAEIKNLEENHASDCMGLKSKDGYTRCKSWLCLCCGVTFVVLAIMLPIIFLVIIPQEVQHAVDNSNLTIMKVTISKPNNESFALSVDQQIKSDTSTSGRIKMKELTLCWNSDYADSVGNERLAVLSSSNSVKITNDPVTIRSTGNVVDTNALSVFNAYLITADTFKWDIKGKADVDTIIKVEVDLEKTVVMSGFNNFPNPPDIQSVIITGGTPTVLSSTIQSKFTNAANIAIDFGQDVFFEIKSFGIKVGRGRLADMNMRTGEFSLEAFVELFHSNDQEKNQVMQIISNYSSGLEAPISMGPFTLENKVIWLQAGLDIMSLPASIPGVQEKVMVKIDLYPNPANPFQVPLFLDVFNPVDVEIKVQHIYADIYSSGLKIGVVDQDVVFTVPARSNVTTPQFVATTECSDSANQPRTRGCRNRIFRYSCSFNGRHWRFPDRSSLQTAPGIFHFPSCIETSHKVQGT